jgi:hypothetical protein
MAYAGGALAHPGHGGAHGHVHTFGVEHFILLVVVAAFLYYAARK